MTKRPKGDAYNRSAQRAEGRQDVDVGELEHVGVVD